MPQKEDAGPVVIPGVLRPPAVRLPQPALLVPALLFSACLTVFLLARRVDFGYDGWIMFKVTESMVVRHSFQITDPVWHANEPYAYFGLGVSLAMLPLFAAGQLLFGNGGRLLPLYEPGITALTVVALYRLLRELGCSWTRSLVLAVGYAFGTLAWHYSTTIFSEPLLALALTLAVLWLLVYRRSGRRRWLAGAGSAAGIALLARWDSTLLVVLPLSIYAFFLVWRGGRGVSHQAVAVATFSLPVAAALGINLAYDWVRYHDALSTGVAFPSLFSTPLVVGLYGLLLSPGAGLLVYVPVLVFSGIAYPSFLRRWRAEALLVLGLVVLRLLFYARWANWDGHEWGPRFLVPILPMLVIPLAFLPPRGWLRGAAVAVGVASVAIEVVGQLVPYSTILWPRTAPVVVSTLHLRDPSGSSCLCSWLVDQAAATAMDFDVRFAPLVGQVRLLLAGTIDPAWRTAPLATGVILLAVAAVLTLLLRMAARLDTRAAG